jgi:hypothetical protein
MAKLDLDRQRNRSRTKEAARMGSSVSGSCAHARHAAAVRNRVRA